MKVLNQGVAIPFAGLGGAQYRQIEDSLEKLRPIDLICLAELCKAE
jgi:hypothetical protein